MVFTIEHMEKKTSRHNDQNSFVAQSTMINGRTMCINESRHMPQHARSSLRLELDASLQIRARRVGPSKAKIERCLVQNEYAKMSSKKFNILN